MPIYFNTTLLTLLHSYMLQASRSNSQRVLVSLVRRVNKIRVHTCKYQTKDKQVICCLAVVKFLTFKDYITDNTFLFNLIFTSGHVFCWPSSQNISVLPEDGP